MNKTVLIIAAAFVVIGGGYFLFSGGGYQTPQETGQPQLGVPAPGQESVPETIVVPQDSENVVTYTNSGYAPVTLAVKAGDTVTFRNESSQKMWVASAIHPTHRAYPNSDIAKCNTAEVNSIFDACGGITSEETWSFIFDQTGNWNYHNHLNPARTGTIVVE